MSTHSLWPDPADYPDSGLDDHVKEWLRKTVKPDDICYDIGAHRGVMTAVMRECGATVYAFEPNPHTFAEFAERHYQDSKVKALCAGLFDYTGIMDFTLSKVSGCCMVGNKVPIEQQDMRMRLTVPVFRLSDLDIPYPDVIKSDTQGAEIRWLSGAGLKLCRVRALIVEHDQMLMRQYGNSVEELQDYIESIGFHREAEQEDDWFYIR